MPQDTAQAAAKIIQTLSLNAIKSTLSFHQEKIVDLNKRNAREHVNTVHFDRFTQKLPFSVLHNDQLYLSHERRLTLDENDWEFDLGLEGFEPQTRSINDTLKKRSKDNYLPVDRVSTNAHLHNSSNIRVAKQGNSMVLIMEDRLHHWTQSILETLVDIMHTIYIILSRIEIQVHVCDQVPLLTVRKLLSAFETRLTGIQSF